MTRSRFEQLLRSLHFCDNTTPDGDRLYKIRAFVGIFNANCERIYRPGKEVAIDESLVPFRGRILFRQYIPSKKHKYGIKLFKLCSRGGYTWRTTIYAGKTIRDESVADSVVFSLMDGLLDHGRQLCCDNWYSSVGLAKKLLNRKTHLIATMRKNRRGIPILIKGKRLRRGELYYQQNKDGIMILKWKDKRDLLMISTVHDGEIGPSNKPVVVEDYNKLMGFVDQSDQMSAYSPFVRRTTKWYIRIFFHFVTQMAIVNSWRLFCDSKEKIRLNEFKMNLVESLLHGGLNEAPSPRVNHKLEKARVGSKEERRRCIGCYKELCEEKRTHVCYESYKESYYKMQQVL